MAVKTRPLVDPSVYDLARQWMAAENYAIHADTADAASDALEDVTWDLADEIQKAIEGFLTDAIEQGRIREV